MWVSRFLNPCILCISFNQWIGAHRGTNDLEDMVGGPPSFDNDPTHRRTSHHSPSFGAYIDFVGTWCGAQKHPCFPTRVQVAPELFRDMIKDALTEFGRPSFRSLAMHMLVQSFAMGRTKCLLMSDDTCSIIHKTAGCLRGTFCPSRVSKPALIVRMWFSHCCTAASARPFD